MTRLTKAVGIGPGLVFSPLAQADSAHLQVVQAVVGKGEAGQGEYVDVTFTPGSRGPLAEFTRTRVGKRVEFRVDDRVLTVVTVQGAIDTSGLRMFGGGRASAASRPRTSRAFSSPAPTSRSPTPASGSGPRAQPRRRRPRRRHIG